MDQMSPNFLVIGTPKSGSTWLQFVLSSHPDIFIPGEINEIHYFDNYIKEKPVEWYFNFFTKAKSEKAVGEVTPHYLYVPDKRIFEKVPTIHKFIVILRNPVERCIFHYKFMVRIDNYTGSFKEFLKDYPAALKWGLYGMWLEQFLRVYSRDQLLVLVFEEATREPRHMLKEIAGFLDIDENKFDTEIIYKRINEGFKPKLSIVYNFAIRVSRLFMKWELYALRNALKKIVKPVISARDKQSEVSVSEKERGCLMDYYTADIKKLEAILGLTREPWPVDI